MRLRFGMILVAAVVLCACLGTRERIAVAGPTDPASPTEEPKKDEKKTDKAPSFKDDVMPIFNGSCAGCHITMKKGRVDLSTYEGALKTVKAGEPDKSKLVKSVLGKGAKLMPPKKGLPDSQVQILKAWIAAGAKND